MSGEAVGSEIETVGQRLALVFPDVAWLAVLIAATCSISMWIPNGAVFAQVAWAIVVCAACCAATAVLIPVFAIMTRDGGKLSGRDLGKRFDPVRSKAVV